MTRRLFIENENSLHWMDPPELENKLENDASSPPDITLTPRQNQVLQALTNGFSTKQIASQLHLSNRTILMHVHALKERLGVITREQVILKALSLGLLEKK